MLSLSRKGVTSILNHNVTELVGILARPNQHTKFPESRLDVLGVLGEIQNREARKMKTCLAPFHRYQKRPPSPLDVACHLQAQNLELPQLVPYYK